MRRVLSIVLAALLVVGFCSLVLAEDKKESTTGKGMMQGNMMGSEGMMWTGKEGMMGKSGMMMRKHKMMGEWGGSCGMMAKSMMMGKSMVATSDGGVIVMMGNKLLKYDKNLNLIKEVEIKIDVEGMQAMMKQMMEKCPMSEKGE